MVRMNVLQSGNTREYQPVNHPPPRTPPSPNYEEQGPGWGAEGAPVSFAQLGIARDDAQLLEEALARADHIPRLFPQSIGQVAYGMKGKGQQVHGSQ